VVWKCCLHKGIVISPLLTTGRAHTNDITGCHKAFLLQHDFNIRSILLLCVNYPRVRATAPSAIINFICIISAEVISFLRELLSLLSNFKTGKRIVLKQSKTLAFGNYNSGRYKWY
jgi:hypothetical protein